MTTITLFHGLGGWTAAGMVAFALGTMVHNLEAEIAIWLERHDVRAAESVLHPRLKDRK